MKNVEKIFGTLADNKKMVVYSFVGGITSIELTRDQVEAIRAITNKTLDEKLEEIRK